MNFNTITDDDKIWIENNRDYFTKNITKSNEFLNRLVEVNGRIKGQIEYLQGCGRCVKNMIDFVWAQYTNQK
jgi:hypothetical protein